MLVRYNSFGSQPRWYRATDGLRGTDVYGYPGLGEYSVYFRHLMKPESELLFVIGSCCEFASHELSTEELVCRWFPQLDDHDVG